MEQTGIIYDQDEFELLSLVRTDCDLLTRQHSLEGAIIPKVSRGYKLGSLYVLSFIYNIQEMNYMSFE